MPKPILPRSSSEAEPLITLSLLQASLLVPFLLSRRRHQDGARWDSPSGQGRRVLRPEAGSRKGGCEDVFGGSRSGTRRGQATWSRCTSKRTSEGRVGHGLGRSQAGRALVPWARASVVCQNGGLVLPYGRCRGDQLGRAQSLAVMPRSAAAGGSYLVPGDIGPNAFRDLRGRD